ncbi:phosphatase domain-containing protein [Bdellovibrio sp. HCB337]|uniref:phosphatase domain-containing protein n=1 Tax=Bdellovibrio sp. HCB337 TaxID=3394358 RepID=UPI0039A42348
MSRFLLLVLFLFSGGFVNAQTPPVSGNLHQKPLIISGFDDVLRQAENTGLTKAALKILEDDKTFAGMPELYQVITSEESGKIKFTLISGIATWFHKRIENFLKESHYPASRLYLRNWFTEWSIGKFKTGHIENLLAENPERKFIVIFDNSGPSIELANELYKKHADKIHPVYLRQTVLKQLPSQVVPFITAYDIAISEFQMGRLQQAEVEKVATAILIETKTEHLVPSYAYCPVDYNPCGNTPPGALPLCEVVRSKIVTLCKLRQK